MKQAKLERVAYSSPLTSVSIFMMLALIDKTNRIEVR